MGRDIAHALGRMPRRIARLSRNPFVTSIPTEDSATFQDDVRGNGGGVNEVVTFAGSCEEVMRGFAMRSRTTATPCARVQEEWKGLFAAMTEPPRSTRTMSVKVPPASTPIRRARRV